MYFGVLAISLVRSNLTMEMPPTHTPRLSDSPTLSSRLVSRWTRIATQDLVAAAEKQLLIAGLGGFGRYSSDRPLAAPLHRLPRCTLCLDHGPDNLCALGYLLNQRRLRLSCFFSPTHKIQRCLFGAADDNGTHSHLLVASNIVTALRAPWNTSEHGREIRECLDAWVEHMGISEQRVGEDAALAVCAPIIARARHWPHPEFPTTQQKLRIVETVKRANFYHATPRAVAMTRWNTLNDALEELLAERGEYLLAGIAHGASVGWARPDMRAEWLDALHPLE